MPFHRRTLNFTCSLYRFIFKAGVVWIFCKEGGGRAGLEKVPRCFGGRTKAKNLVWVDYLEVTLAYTPSSEEAFPPSSSPCIGLMILGLFISFSFCLFWNLVQQQRRDGGLKRGGAYREGGGHWSCGRGYRRGVAGCRRRKVGLIASRASGDSPPPTSSAASVPTVLSVSAFLWRRPSLRCCCMRHQKKQNEKEMRDLKSLEILQNRIKLDTYLPREDLLILVFSSLVRIKRPSSCQDEKSIE